MKVSMFNSLVIAAEPVSPANAQDILTSAKQPFKGRLRRKNKESNRLPANIFLDEFHVKKGA